MLDERRICFECPVVIFKICVGIARHGVVAHIGRHLICLDKRIVIRIEVGRAVVYDLRQQIVGKRFGEDSAHILVRRSRVAPHHSVESHCRSVFMIQSAAGRRSVVVGHRTGYDMRTPVGIRALAVGIYAAAVFSSVALHRRARNRCACQQI